MIAKLSYRKLRNEMVEKNLKQESFAEMIGISDRHVRNLCNRDMNISVSLCYRLSIALKTSMESLLVIYEEEDE